MCSICAARRRRSCCRTPRQVVLLLRQNCIGMALDNDLVPYRFLLAVFQDVRIVKPKASRAESSEIYLLARRKRGS